MPLISLIEDNITFVRSLGIPCVSLSTQSDKEDKRGAGIYSSIRNAEYKLVYLTPEKLVKSPRLLEILKEMYKENLIDRFVVDEVHCVSHWGQDFRKDYLNLSMIKDHFERVPILGLTATATIKVKEDITVRLRMKDTLYF